MVSAMFVFSYILICFVQTTTYWDSLLQGVSKNPHVSLCRFVPLGRRSSDHWCFSCCLPGGEWGKGPNGSPTGTTGDKHRESGHICSGVEMKPLGEWTRQRVFFVVAGREKLKKSWFRKDKFMQIAQMFMVQWKIGHFQGRSREDHQVQPSEKNCPCLPKHIPSKKVALLQKCSAKTSWFTLGPFYNCLMWQAFVPYLGVSNSWFALHTCARKYEILN